MLQIKKGRSGRNNAIQLFDMKILIHTFSFLVGVYTKSGNNFLNINYATVFCFLENNHTKPKTFLSGMNMLFLLTIIIHYGNCSLTMITNSNAAG